MRNNSDIKYVPRVARVFVVSMLLFSPLPSEKAARDEEEGHGRMKASLEGHRLKTRLVVKADSHSEIASSKSNTHLRASSLLVTKVNAIAGGVVKAHC